LTANGRRLRNLIHGADIVMSHITHTYHLAALDYINASHLGHPWNPSIGATDMLDGSVSTGKTLVDHYVEALGVRRKVHTMSSLIGGRHPMQNAIVPGGATTLLNQTNGLAALQTFKTLLDEVRVFVNKTYLLDVVTIAQAYGFGNATFVGSATAGTYTTGAAGMKNYFAYGTGCGNLLSYGDFDTDGAQTNPKLLLKRARVHVGTAALGTGITGVGPYTAFDQRKIVEFVGWSHYENFNYLSTAPSATNYAHPWDGETKVSFQKSWTGNNTSYSWMKAPRYLADGGELKQGGGTYAANDPIVYEVGPLARMVATYYVNDTCNVDELANSPLALGDNYTPRALVNKALDVILGSTTPAQAVHANIVALWSVLGRHGARMLECKYLADAMAVWIDEVIAAPTVAPYTYIKIPKVLKKGVGLVEAPRGALGHWIKIEKKRVLKYQCVVPSTWNISPRDDTYTAGTWSQLGAAEQMIARATTLGNGSDIQNQVIDLLRMLHTFDFCSACAIHLTSPDKKLLAIIHMDTDGSTRVEYPE